MLTVNGIRVFLYVLLVGFAPHADDIHPLLTITYVSGCLLQSLWDLAHIVYTIRFTYH